MTRERALARTVAYFPELAAGPSVVGLAESQRPIIEQQYWWGPEFNDVNLAVNLVTLVAALAVRVPIESVAK